MSTVAPRSGGQAEIRHPAGLPRKPIDPGSVRPAAVRVHDSGTRPLRLVHRSGRRRYVGVVTNKQRQRQLARAKWERQQAKRMSDARRHRVISLVVGVIVGLIVVALLGWLVLHIIDQ